MKGKVMSDEWKKLISIRTKIAMDNLPPEKREKLRSCLGKPPLNKGTKCPEWIKAKKWKPVSQFTKDGVFMRTYKSALEAQEITGICRSSICFCLKGRYKLAGGFIWKYA